MKNASGSSIARLLAAIIIGVVFIFLIGTVANGWQNKSNNDDNNSGDTDGTIGDADESNGDTDGNEGTADNNNQDSIIPDEPKQPEFTSYLTGLEIPPELNGRLPYVITVEPGAPLYGISGSEITVEIPTECGETRFLVYRSEISTLGKIGAIAKTRNYISQIAKFFGGILIANGNEDIVSYNALPSTLHIDLSKNIEYIYRENGKNVYTDYHNLNEIIKNNGIDTSTYIIQQIPFDFCDYFDTVSGKASANSVILPYENNESTLTYNIADKCYFLSKNGRDKVDMLDGKTASYKNVFVLFADMVTYEMSSGTETVVNTATKGTGYYISEGKLTEIRWNVESNGQLVFKHLTGEKLVVNRGNSYLGYYKASDSNSVVFE